MWRTDTYTPYVNMHCDLIISEHCIKHRWKHTQHGLECDQINLNTSSRSLAHIASRSQAVAPTNRLHHQTKKTTTIKQELDANNVDEDAYTTKKF